MRAPEVGTYHANRHVCFFIARGFEEKKQKANLFVVRCKNYVA